VKKLFPILICSVLIVGCNNNGNDAADEENPLVRKGLEQVHLKNWDKAVELFQEALMKRSDLARPDLELALIYHQHKDRFAYAIYHYEQYLKKRPNTEKKPLIHDWIRQAEISFAGEIGHTSGNISGELVRLRRENNLLRKQLETFSKTPIPAPQVTAVKTIIDEPPEVPSPTPQPTPKTQMTKSTQTDIKSTQHIQPLKPKIQTYNVLPGDSLTRIARKIYGDGSLWRKIYEANRDQMKNETDLRAGQVIQIPPLIQ
jgi:tetratricopeptide (TPR) repeat protein